MREKIDTFAFRLTEDDRRRLDALARRLQRSRGDALRWLLRRATTDPEYPNGRPDGLPPLPLQINGDMEQWGWAGPLTWEDVL